MQDGPRHWFRAFRVKLTIFVAAVMLLSFLYYAAVAGEFPDSFWMTCGIVGALLFVLWWWRLAP